MARIKFLLLTIFITISSLYGALPTNALAKTTTLTLAGDSQFIDVNALSVDQIRDILKDNKSFLKDFEEGGRSAAQIIYDAAHGVGDASGDYQGISVHDTINPAAILAVLQKEQSLVTMRDRNDNSLRVAMGYGAPDSGGSDPKYHGFTKQVENGAWQLRYNFERAKGNGFKTYQVGDKATIDGKKVVIGNRATSALYRYTPHLGTNFTVLFAKYNPGGSGAGSSESGGSIYNAVFKKSKPKSKKLVLSPGQSVSVQIYYKNTGDITWSNSGENPVKLGTQNPQDAASSLIGGANRIQLSNSSVRPKKKATFVATFTAPQTPGTYNLQLRPVAENKTWFGQATTITLTVR